MTVYLKDMFLGQADGEKESENGKFLEMFYTGNDKYKEITSNKYKYIITGPKGSGKTILSRYIEMNYNNSGILCRILKKDSITLSKLIDLGKDELDLDESSIFFEWFFITEISKIILENELTRAEFSKNIIEKYIFNKKYNKYKEIFNKLKKLFNERYSKGNYENDTYTILSQIKSEIKAGTQEIAGTLESTEGDEILFKLKPYYKFLKELENLVMECMKYYEVVLILDDVDEIKVKFDENTEYLQTIEKLIMSMDMINKKLRDNDSDVSKCILLLRSDILEVINRKSSNLNKIIIDSSAELYWLDKDINHPEEHMLVDMILNKIKISCKEYKNYSNKDLYYKIFPEHVNKKSALYYFLDMSFGRPRDIITYLNIIKRRFKDSEYFSPKNIILCEAEYSKIFLDELYNELSIHKSKEYVDDIFKLLKEFNHRTFKFDQINLFYKNNKYNYPNIIDIETCLADLYCFGIIGNTYLRKKSNGKKKRYFSWSYRRDGSNYVDYNKEFTVHNALRKSLGLK